MSASKRNRWAVLAVACGLGAASVVVAKEKPARHVAGACGPGMAFVPGGRFTMGERGEVAVDGFCMDLSEVTLEEYNACIADEGCARKEPTSHFCNFVNSGRERHPVNCVDFEQAAAYCEKHSKRLPSDEEWEWAARGGERGNRFPWGNDPIATQACWDGPGNDAGLDKRTSTCAVGSHPQGDNPQGIHDLAGNVWEWTTGREGDKRIIRGGGWDTYRTWYLMTRYRYGIAADYRNTALGFRCAKSAKNK
jgi:formylglycine-generating enzyme required for sulfatase activity